MNQDERARTYGISVLPLSLSPSLSLSLSLSLPRSFSSSRCVLQVLPISPMSDCACSDTRIRLRCFHIYRVDRDGRNEIRKLAGARLIISRRAIAIIPRDFMDISISADCYRQLHDARLIFNAIADVETNNSRLLAFPCLCRCPLAPFDANGCSLFVSILFFFSFQRGRDAGTLIEICNFQHES